jgi:hypothetical protein
MNSVCDRSSRGFIADFTSRVYSGIYRSFILASEDSARKLLCPFDCSSLFGGILVSNGMELRGDTSRNGRAFTLSKRLLDWYPFFRSR